MCSTLVMAAYAASLDAPAQLCPSRSSSVVRGSAHSVDRADGGPRSAHQHARVSTVICGMERSTITPIAPCVHSRRAISICSAAAIHVRRQNSKRSIRHSCCGIPASTTACAFMPSPAPALIPFWLQKTSPRARSRAHRNFGPLGWAAANSRAAELHWSSSF